MLVDDLGSGDVSCLFRDVVKTPNIDRLAKEGVKFTSGYVTARSAVRPAPDSSAVVTNSVSASTVTATASRRIFRSSQVC